MFIQTFFLIICCFEELGVQLCNLQCENASTFLWISVSTNLSRPFFFHSKSSWQDSSPTTLPPHSRLQQSSFRKLRIRYGMLLSLSEFRNQRDTYQMGFDIHTYLPDPSQVAFDSLNLCQMTNRFKVDFWICCGLITCYLQMCSYVIPHLFF